MELNGFINTTASFPMILTHASLNAELTFDQVLPRMPFLVHLMVDEKSAVDSLESVAIEDLAVVGDDLIPTAPLREGQVIKAKDHAQVLTARQRAGKDGAREAFQK